MFRVHIPLGGEVCPATKPRVQELDGFPLVVVDGKIVLAKPSLLETRKGGTWLSRACGVIGLTLGAVGSTLMWTSRSGAARPDTDTWLRGALATGAAIPLLSISVALSWRTYDHDPATVVAARDAMVRRVLTSPQLTLAEVLEADPVSFLAPDELRAMTLSRVASLADMALLNPSVMVRFGAMTLNEARYVGSYSGAWSERTREFEASTNALKQVIEMEMRDQIQVFNARLAAAQGEYESVECVRLLDSLKKSLAARINELRRYRSDRLRALQREGRSAEATVKEQMAAQRAHLISNFEQLNAIDDANLPVPAPPTDATAPPPYAPSAPPAGPPPTYTDAPAELPATDPSKISREAARKATLESELKRLDELEAETLRRTEAAIAEEQAKLKAYVDQQISQAKKDFANHATHLESCVATAASIRDASMEVEKRRLEQAREEVSASHFRRLTPLEDAYKVDIAAMTSSAESAAATSIDSHYVAPAYSTFHLGRELTGEELSQLMAQFELTGGIDGVGHDIVERSP
ncbi:uncharacterized protein AMSG_10430 [Thecamonas trahens ATCC 50062]|uniref:Uncharacterized protein n=1 Tax=Thecamonas trahens ATCC 50062 TaxID=461836 RepID=A0A0L0DRG1_THETB|nr:hypothetical protein AMSG_10430 [Thecamonas trahens ATCC 50062]KNC54576.1 hypothetical protein AMSG_10430 [Thecamonas trahens ATCC 50062]|eukprot:XP_013753589.1 hypothetical protein AMSG_10430 [Thecamonas trahens ATCC 50062]